MDIKPHHSLSQQIEAYLDGLLEGKELEKFKNLLSSDEELSYEVERVRLARMMIKNEVLREKLRTIQSEEIINRILRTPKKHLFLYSLAACIGIIVVITIIKVFSINSEDLFLENYTSYTINPSKENLLENSILYNFSQRNYQDVVNIYENNPNHSNETFFFAGVSYLELNLPDSAINTLRNIIVEAGKGGDHAYLHDAEYYSGFAYLKFKNVDYSDWYFSKIFHDIDHAYNDQLDKWFYLKLRILKFRKKIF